MPLPRRLSIWYRLMLILWGIEMKVHIHDQRVGKIRELHGVNCAPYAPHWETEQPEVKRIFGYARVPRSRLHDACGIYGGCYFVDVPNIFRDFDADPTDPASYEFHYTDEYIATLIQNGAQVVYRLGVTIEWGTKKYTCYPPIDNQKWAVICEHIVRHYNEGWANGFHYGIQYWEIWNEPENPPMWQGTKEQYFELYRVASRHLKSCFPQLKIGGYGSCGFYAAIGGYDTPFYQSFITWFHDFLQFVKQNDCPLDFFSWHIYTEEVEKIVASAEYVRKGLDEAGFTATESHLNEWNYGLEGGGFRMLESQRAAAFCAASLIAMQERAVDMAQYYVLSVGSQYNGWVDLRTLDFSPVIHSFAAFARLFEAGDRLAVTADLPALAAAFDGGLCCLVSNFDGEERPLTVAAENAEGKHLAVYESTDASGFRVICEGTYTEAVTVTCRADGIYYILLSDGNADSYTF